MGAAFVADALHPGMLLVVHVLGIERRVVEQNLDAVGARFLQASHGPVIEQVGQTTGTGLVVSGLLIRQQQAGVLGAALRRRQPPLRIEQDGAGVWGQDFGDQRLEFFHHGVGNLRAFFLSQRFLQRAALVHGGGSDNTTLVGYSFEAGEFSRGELHGISPPG